MHSIYAHYHGADDVAKGITLDDRKTIRRYFAPDIAARMIADEEGAARAGDAPSLEFDPFVNAQDWTITDLTFQTQSEDAQSAHVIVRFKDLNTPDSVELVLVKTPLGWRISNILYPKGGDTLRGLYNMK